MDIRPSCHHNIDFDGAWVNNKGGAKSIGVLMKGPRNIQVVGSDESEAAELFCPSDLEEVNQGKDGGQFGLAEGAIDTTIVAPTQNSGNTRPKRQPLEPTQREVEEHAMTHCP